MTWSAGRSLSNQSGRYLAVGAITFVIYFALLGLFFSLLRLPYPVSVGVAYVPAASVHFLANRAFTFGVMRAPILSQIPRYATTVVLNYFSQLAIVYLVYKVGGLNFYLGAGVGVLATLITGFLMMKSWVFTKS